jgi:hypothetical protein
MFKALPLSTGAVLVETAWFYGRRCLSRPFNLLEHDLGGAHVSAKFSGEPVATQVYRLSERSSYLLSVIFIPLMFTHTDLRKNDQAGV